MLENFPGENPVVETVHCNFFCVWSDWFSKGCDWEDGKGSWDIVWCQHRLGKENWCCM